MGIFSLTIAGLFTLSCQRPVEVATAPVPAPPISEPRSLPPGEGPVLAKVHAFVPQVMFRRHALLEWNDVIQDLPLHRFDAVKTQLQASSQIEFLSGSELSMTENTLVIINPLKAREEGTADRAILSNGNVKGLTPTELWVLTSVALLRVRAKSPEEKGEATLSLVGNKSLRIELQHGAGELVTRKKNETQVASLVPNVPIEIAVTAGSPTLGESETDWELGNAKAARATAPLPPREVKLSIQSPPNYSEVKAAEIALKGKLSAPGAQLLIEGNRVTIGKDLRFSSKFRLSKGANMIRVQLIQPDGRSSFKQWMIIRR